MLTLLNPNNPYEDFPPVENAMTDPDGLLAVGGDLSPPRLLKAYRQGVFPWYNAGEPILWWSPDPRLVLFPDKLKIASSLRKVLKQGNFDVTFDHAFHDVIDACSAPRKGETGTWITPEMKDAYFHLSRMGHAHSVETWHDGELVGGLYGVAIGQVFFGESMFYRRSNASKVAFAVLVENLKQWGYALIDCQVYTSHLASLGAEPVSRREFISLLRRWCNEGVTHEAWQS